MSNSFNISVKPEIAAVSAKVDANKTVIDAIRNDVTSIHDIGLPAVIADCDALRNDVTALHDTMLPAVKIDTGAIRNDMNDVHDSYLPEIKTDTGAIRNDVTDIKDIDLPAAIAEIALNTATLDDIHDTDLPAVKSVVDALPTSNRGTLSASVYNETSTSYLSRINVSGSGYIYFMIANLPGGNTTTIRITIDGRVSNELALTDAETYYIFIQQPTAAGLTIAESTTATPFAIEFKTSFLLETKVSAGSTLFSTLYAVD